MIGLDTHVLVRYLTNDDPKQSAAAARQIRARCTSEDPGYIDLIVLCELVWVLDAAYGYEKTLIAETIDAIRHTPHLRIERADLLDRALERFRDSRVDLADCLIGIVNAADGCSATLTFDKAAAQIEGFESLA